MLLLMTRVNMWLDFFQIVSFWFLLVVVAMMVMDWQMGTYSENAVYLASPQRMGKRLADDELIRF